MLKVTLKGLAAHKLRFVLTAVAVMIGIAFLSGTLVFTDTIRKTFDDLFADIYRNTDAVVRAPTVFETNFGDQRARVPASTLDAGACGPGGCRRRRRHPSRLRADRRRERRPDR